MTAVANNDDWKVAIANEVRQHHGRIHPAGYAVASTMLAHLFDTDDPMEVSRLSDQIIAKLKQETAWAK